MEAALAGAFRMEDEEGLRGRSWAARKSGWREDELGEVMPAERGVSELGKPRNWEVRSLYCWRRGGAWSALLLGVKRVSGEGLRGRGGALTWMGIVLEIRCLRVGSRGSVRCGCLGRKVRGLGRWRAGVRGERV